MNYAGYDTSDKQRLVKKGVRKHRGQTSRKMAASLCGATMQKIDRPAEADANRERD